MSSPVLEAARAEREQLEERCAWHRGQLDRLEQQLEALKEIERLAERLGHGTAGEAPPATAPGGGVSPQKPGLGRVAVRPPPPPPPHGYLPDLVDVSRSSALRTAGVLGATTALAGVGYLAFRRLRARGHVPA